VRLARSRCYSSRAHAFAVAEAEAVIEPVAHPEAAAAVPPLEAALVVAQQEAGFVERLVGAGAPAAEPEPVLCLRLQRKPEALVAALRTGRPLARCRQDLEAHGHAWELPGGGMAFVHPEQYRAALRSCEPASHCLLVSASLEHLVAETFASVAAAGADGLGLRGGYAKAATELALGSDATEGEAAAQLAQLAQLGVPAVERTFVTWRAARADARTVAQSTTEATSAHGENPRRRALFWEVEP
jgi:hypothetical protein